MRASGSLRLAFTSVFLASSSFLWVLARLACSARSFSSVREASPARRATSSAPRSCAARRRPSLAPASLPEPRSCSTRSRAHRSSRASFFAPFSTTHGPPRPSPSSRPPPPPPASRSPRPATPSGYPSEDDPEHPRARPGSRSGRDSSSPPHRAASGRPYRSRTAAARWRAEPTPSSVAYSHSARNIRGSGGGRPGSPSRARIRSYSADKSKLTTNAQTIRARWSDANWLSRSTLSHLSWDRSASRYRAFPVIPCLLNPRLGNYK